MARDALIVRGGHSPKALSPAGNTIDALIFRGGHSPKAPVSSR